MKGQEINMANAKAKAKTKTPPVNPKAEIYDAVVALAKEKDISVDYIVTAIEDACMTAFKKTPRYMNGIPMNLACTLTREKGVQIFSRKVVTNDDDIEDDELQISLEDARELQPNCELGDIVEFDVTPDDFGRVAAGAAKQMMIQRLREAERGKVYDEFSDKENEILTGIVLRVDQKSVQLELGRTQGVLDANDFIPGEEYHEGDHLKVYVLQVARQQRDGGIAQIKVSRTHTGLVKRLFEMEVPEIATGIVQIKSIAREAGSRTKMAVFSSDPAIDPVGACVGPRGIRVDRVVTELKNEKIDIIKWSSDPAEFVANALNPAHVISVFVSDKEKICRVVVPDSQLSLAIGKEGQNARLAARLTGWKIDIKSQAQVNEIMQAQQGDEAVPQQQGQVIADDYDEYDHYTSPDEEEIM